MSGPRSSRLSWMLLRFRLAMMSVYVGHVRAARVTEYGFDAGAAAFGAFE